MPTYQTKTTVLTSRFVKNQRGQLVRNVETAGPGGRVEMTEERAEKINRSRVARGLDPVLKEVSTRARGRSKKGPESGAE